MIINYKNVPCVVLNKHKEICRTKQVPSGRIIYEIIHKNKHIFVKKEKGEFIQEFRGGKICYNHPKTKLNGFIWFQGYAMYYCLKTDRKYPSMLHREDGPAYVAYESPYNNNNGRIAYFVNSKKINEESYKDYLDEFLKTVNKQKI